MNNRDDAITVLKANCTNTYDCKSCDLNNKCRDSGRPGVFSHWSDAELNEAATKIIQSALKPAETSDPDAPDMVNHPPHYTRKGAMESIDEIEMFLGTVGTMHFCIGNVLKYRYRAADKNGEEDLKKSDWYMGKYRELYEKVKRGDIITATGLFG